MKKLKPFDIGSFFVEDFFGDDGFQNMLVYTPTFSTLDLKENNLNKLVNKLLLVNQKDYLKLNFICCIILSGLRYINLETKYE